MSSRLKRAAKALFFAIALFSLIALIFSYALFIPLPSKTTPLIFYATPKRDHLKLTFLKAIEQANDTISISIYQITDKEVLSALKQKAAAGVRVDLSYYHSTNKKLHRLEGKNFHCHPKKGKGLMHEKLLITDSTSLFFGSTNLTPSSLIMHDNCLLGIYAPKLAAALQKERRPFYRHLFKTGQQLDLFTLPKGSDQALKKLLNTLSRAKKRVVIALFTFTHPLLIDQLIALHQRGVAIKLFLDGYVARGASKRAVNRLLTAGIFVAVSQGAPLFHHKWALVDDSTLIIGSANWTRAAFGKNHELLGFLTPLTQKEQRIFKRTIALFQKQTRPLIVDFESP